MAEQERAEIEIIRSYLPRQLSEKEVRSAIAAAIEDTGAASIRDMGKVMAHLKAHHMGKMDFARPCRRRRRAPSPSTRRWGARRRRW
jgi:uncharacterized protein YqeY